ncbi:MAG TPA: hypothetical protein VFK05_19560 [Polyangiaceae bacterium]|nr:hypothetical protein [Polyangiaceae bacterium]
MASTVGGSAGARAATWLGASARTSVAAGGGALAAGGGALVLDTGIALGGATSLGCRLAGVGNRGA